MSCISTRFLTIGNVLHNALMDASNSTGPKAIPRPYQMNGEVTKVSYNGFVCFLFMCHSYLFIPEIGIGFSRLWLLLDALEITRMQGCGKLLICK